MKQVFGLASTQREGKDLADKKQPCDFFFFLLFFGFMVKWSCTCSPGVNYFKCHVLQTFLTGMVSQNHVTIEVGKKNCRSSRPIPAQSRTICLWLHSSHPWGSWRKQSDEPVFSALFSRLNKCCSRSVLCSSPCLPWLQYIHVFVDCSTSEAAFLWEYRAIIASPDLLPKFLQVQSSRRLTSLVHCWLTLNSCSLSSYLLLCKAAFYLDNLQHTWGLLLQVQEFALDFMEFYKVSASCLHLPVKI